MGVLTMPPLPPLKWPREEPKEMQPKEDPSPEKRTKGTEKE